MTTLRQLRDQRARTSKHGLKRTKPVRIRRRAITETSRAEAILRIFGYHETRARKPQEGFFSLHRGQELEWIYRDCHTEYQRLMRDPLAKTGVLQQAWDRLTYLFVQHYPQLEPLPR